MNDINAPVVRRAILDLLNAIGGEENDDSIAMMLSELGHRAARREVADQMRWLAEQGLLVTDVLGPYLAGRISDDGRDLADGKLRIDGVSRFKTRS